MAQDIPNRKFVKPRLRANRSTKPIVASMDQKMFAILVGRKGVRIDDLHPTAVQVVSLPEEHTQIGRLQYALCGTTNGVDTLNITYIIQLHMYIYIYIYI